MPPPPLLISTTNTVTTAWTTYWTPLFRLLTTHSLNPCRQIRGQSLSTLQRLLLSPCLGLDNLSATASPATAFARTATLFTDVTFPLVMQLLKPEVFQSDPVGMGETRLQAAVLACKVFIRYLDTLLDPSIAPPSNTMASGPLSPTTEKTQTQTLTSTLPSVDETSLPSDPAAGTVARTPPPQQASQSQQQPPQWDGIRLWSRILQMMERLIKSSSVAQSGQGAGDGIDEAIGESLKNVVLVMANAGFLVAPSQAPPASAPAPPASEPAGEMRQSQDQAQSEEQSEDQDQAKEEGQARSSEKQDNPQPPTSQPPPTTSSSTSQPQPTESRSPQQARLWHVTQVRLERFQPELIESIFPASRKGSGVGPSSVGPPPMPTRPGPPRADEGKGAVTEGVAGSGSGRNSVEKNGVGESSPAL